MNLENVTVEMRPRSEWEASDFGVRMIRRDVGAVYRVWFAITLPLLALTLLLIAYSPFAPAAPLLYWWLEPIADGPMLRIISRRLFGEDADVRAALAETPSLAWRNRIFLLPPYRFHFARSIAIPVTQLEGLSGAARRARAKILNQKILNHGIGVTTTYQHLAMSLYIGVLLVGYTFIPAAYQETVGTNWMELFWDDSSRTAGAVSLLVIYVAQTALQPWFVGAGFGLYINCRTQLEAWDIEVAFRRMVQRRSNGLTAALIAAVLLVPTVLLSDHSFADEVAVTGAGADTADQSEFAGYWTDDEVATAITAVMANDALQTSREVERWRSINDDEIDEETDSELPQWWQDMLASIGWFVSFVVEFALWIAVAVLVYVIFATRDRWWPLLSSSRRRGTAATRVILADGEITAEHMPTDVPTEVMRLWKAGRKREALSLLYRASVFVAVTEHGVKLPKSATEGACITAVAQQTDAQELRYFRRVVTAWIHCAYDSEAPGDATVVPLCDEWAQHYRSAT